MKITDISQLKDGMKVNFRSGKGHYHDYVITIEDNLCFISGIPFDDDQLVWDNVQNVFKISWHIITDLETVERTLDDVQAGDILVKDEYRYKVLGRLEDIIFISFIEDSVSGFDRTNNYYTIYELKETGYKLESEVTPSTLKVTRKQVAEKFGVDEVEIVEE
jgi:hypothetical protein